MILISRIDCECGSNGINKIYILYTNGTHSNFEGRTDSDSLITKRYTANLLPNEFIVAIWVESQDSKAIIVFLKYFSIFSFKRLTIIEKYDIIEKIRRRLYGAKPKNKPMRKSKYAYLFSPRESRTVGARRRT